MDDSKYDHLPEDIRQKVLESRRAYLFASELSRSLNEKFAIADLSVAVSGNKSVSISGVVDSEDEKLAVQVFLKESGSIDEVSNGLTVFENDVEVPVLANRESFRIKTLAQLKAVFDRSKENEFVEYYMEGRGESSIVLLTNREKALAIYLRYPGDSGYTTVDPNGSEEDYQDFGLANGQIDAYPACSLVDKDQGHEILKHYLFTGDMYTDVHWKEE